MEKWKIENKVSAGIQKGWSTRGRQTEESIAVEITKKLSGTNGKSI